MRLAYIIAMLVVMAIIIVAFFHSTKHKSESALVIRACLGLGTISVLANILIAISTSYVLSTISYSLFYISLDWVLLTLMYFIFLFVGKDPKRYTFFRWLAIGLAILDSIDIALTIKFHHVFQLGDISFDGATVIGTTSFSLSYYIHLGLCYIVVILIFIMLIKKLVISPKFYARKYLMILISFLVVIALDGVSILINSPLNYGVVFYGLLSAFICFYSLSYVPEGLINNTVKLAVESMKSGIICFDVEGKFAYANSFVWKIFDVEPDAALAERAFRDRMEKYALSTREFYTWSEHNFFEEIHTYLECEYRKMYDSSNNFVGAYFHIMDVTDRVKAYEEQIQKAEAESKAKSDFVSKISHEIRTPINSVYGMDEMILRECKDPQILEYAQDIKNSAEVMICIINDVLDFSKIESGKMELVYADYEILSIIRNLQHMIEVRTKAKGIDFYLDISPDLPSVLYGDAVRLEQIIINLLTNAAKYTNEGEVRMKVECVLGESDAELTFIVSDTGIGIKKEDIPKLCDAFERVEEIKNHSIQGTGLGLNIVAQILKIMDSELVIESEYGKGSIFKFTIKQKIVKRTPAVEQEKQKKQLEKYVAAISAPDKKILVVDDNAINRKVIRGLLKQTEISITEAAGGKECLELVQKEYFDIIFLDHMMPEMDGVETFQTMKTYADYPCKETPVVMLTANAIGGAKDKYLAIGFDDFLAKPVIPMELEKIIAKYVYVEGE